VSPAELVATCLAAIEREGEGAAIVLVLPGRMGATGRKRLFGRGNPVGEGLCETERGVPTRFAASEVLAALKARGVIA